jgi:hypothetical protein
MMATRKPYIKVLETKDRKDGTCDIKLEANQVGIELIMQAGVQKVLQDFIAENTGKLSLWQKLQICWGILK